MLITDGISGELASGLVHFSLVVPVELVVELVVLVLFERVHPQNELLNELVLLVSRQFRHGWGPFRSSGRAHIMVRIR